MTVPEEITFHSTAAQVGQVALYTSEEEIRMVFASQGSDAVLGRGTWSRRSRSVRREEVLAVRGPVAERMRVTFVEDLTTTDTDGQKDRTVGPLAGNTFDLERKSDSAPVAVCDAKGARVRFGLAAQVTGHYRRFGRADDAEAAKLPSGPQRVGQSSEDIARALTAEVSQSVTVTHARVHQATLGEIRRGPKGALHGLYQVALEISGESEGSKVTLNLTGTLLLRDADGARLEVRLQGSIKSTPVPGADGVVDPQIPAGAGDFKFTQTIVHGQA